MATAATGVLFPLSAVTLNKSSFSTETCSGYSPKLTMVAASTPSEKKQLCVPDICSHPRINHGSHYRCLQYFSDSSQRIRFASLRKSSATSSTSTTLVRDDRTDTEGLISCYSFPTEIGGLLKALVGTRADTDKYFLRIEVSSFPTTIGEIALKWGAFRSDPSCLVSLQSGEPLPLSDKGSLVSANQAPDHLSSALFAGTSPGNHSVELEFDRSRAPFFLSFVLAATDKQGATSGFASEVRTHKGTKFCVPVGINRGDPAPLGVTFQEDGSVNFALFSRNAESVVFCLFSDIASEPSLEIALDPHVNRTGDIWHVSLPSLDNYIAYGYRCNGSILWDRGSRFHARYVLLDPYAKIISNFFPDPEGGGVSLAKCFGLLQQVPSFDWSGDIPLRLPKEELVVYRLNVGLFTQDPSSQLSAELAGTFAGVAEKVDHFKQLGVNAILLEPIFSFDEHKGPYFPYHFFSPMASYGPEKNALSAILSLKNMVKTLHANGIEVILEVVFSHTAEGGDDDAQMISFRGLDNSSYYDFDGNISGTNNSMKLGNPVVQKMVLDSLRHWVVDYHIDGFCFVGSSSFIQVPNGSLLPRPALIEAISFDPLLSKTKLIADSWSPIGMTHTEARFPHWKRWAETNSRFCADARNFLRGEGSISDLATRLCGSGDIFSDLRGPSFSFNFVTRNHGLPLVDLVSFSRKQLSSELSWNCGEEGPTTSPAVLDLRLRQIRNFLFVLFMSLGVPVLNMGDECGLSTGGSTSYAKRPPFNWASLETSFAAQITNFIAFLNLLRSRRKDLLQVKNFLKVESIEWRGNDQSEPNWQDPSCKFLAVLLKVEKGEDMSGLENVDLSGSKNADLFIAFNASSSELGVALPQPAEGYSWARLVDTALSFPGFFSEESDFNDEQVLPLSAYQMKSHSCVLFEEKLNESGQDVASDSCL